MTQRRGARRRLAVDIGGTFTDLVLELPDRTLSAKLLTTHAAPDEAVLEGTRRSYAKRASPRRRLTW
jgi:N-methylhydantoinase A/oxoprolinase/acetone carboxylase beta subunit